MKCSKCGYLGFERVDRCRNCGYDFSLTSSAVPDFAIRSGSETLNPLDDLSLIDAAAAPVSSAAWSDAGPDLDRVCRAELPLFGPPIPDDEPLIRKASRPRPPLAVRRATPEVPRLRAELPRMQTLDLGLDTASETDYGTATAQARGSAETWREPRPTPVVEEDAAVGARFLAVAMDLAILLIVDAVVIYFTMEICGLAVQDLDILPKGPLLAFLFVQNGGYIVAFTAVGQTLGKMVAGIRVVPTESGAPLDLGRAFLRTLMWVVLAVPAGLGFVTALVGRDHRGLHDRFAGTRVVRASA